MSNLSIHYLEIAAEDGHGEILAEEYSGKMTEAISRNYE